jgi:hypothetical protein
MTNLEMLIYDAIKSGIEQDGLSVAVNDIAALMDRQCDHVRENVWSEICRYIKHDLSNAELADKVWAKFKEK